MCLASQAQVQAQTRPAVAPSPAASATQLGPSDAPSHLLVCCFASLFVCECVGGCGRTPSRLYGFTKAAREKLCSSWKWPRRLEMKKGPRRNGLRKRKNRDSTWSSFFVYGTTNIIQEEPIIGQHSFQRAGSLVARLVVVMVAAAREAAGAPLAPKITACLGDKSPEPRGWCSNVPFQARTASNGHQPRSRRLV